MCVCVSFDKCSYVPPPEGFRAVDGEKDLCYFWTALGTGLLAFVGFMVRISFLSRDKHSGSVRRREAQNSNNKNNRCGFF